jgi:hypothetical protein
MEAVTAFVTERPKDQRVYVVARDPETGKSRSVTVYGVNPDQFVEAVKARASKPRRQRREQPAA